MLIDESHNLRNREGRRYRAIRDYISRNDSKVLLLSATPYNKTYLDLGSQLRLFLADDRDIGIRPEQALKSIGETEFIRRHQCGLRTLAAFEHSEHADDWRDLMRLYLVRRTRSFIQDNYAETDPENNRRYLTFPDGQRSYFPTRVPRTVKFRIDDTDPRDQYARLYAADVVDTIGHLELPRYGLGTYYDDRSNLPDRLTSEEQRALDDLSRAGRRLIGFCRTNLFKRLESSGSSFLLSLERHILRNYVYLHAIETGKPLPLGTQDADLLDTREHDDDIDELGKLPLLDNDEDDNHSNDMPASKTALWTEDDFRRQAAIVYAAYQKRGQRRFRWLRPTLFRRSLAEDLHKDAAALLSVLHTVGEWDPARDTKLSALRDLIAGRHVTDKVVVFTQFADTVVYLERQLARSGVEQLAGVTGQSADPTSVAWQFSPVSNDKRAQVPVNKELRVLVATDVLSEGQNLQDAAIVVNYDLPWAIIRLIQRAGRVDRIGQKADEILCYSFLPADGVERIIRLRDRVRARLRQNAEVVGTDEQFFEDDDTQAIVNLYNEQAGILDGDDDADVDLGSYAYQIWKNAIRHDRTLEKIIPALPSVVYSTKKWSARPNAPSGVLVYTRTEEGNDALAWVDHDGMSVTESQLAILKAAECSPNEMALSRQEQHHVLVSEAVKMIAEDQKRIGGGLGSRFGARFRVYDRLKAHAEALKNTLFRSLELERALDDIYRFPLRGVATDNLNRQLRLGVTNETLAELVIELRAEGRLCQVEEQEESRDPQIICSLGLAAHEEA